MPFSLTVVISTSLTLYLAPDNPLNEYLLPIEASKYAFELPGEFPILHSHHHRSHNTTFVGGILYRVGIQNDITVLMLSAALAASVVAAAVADGAPCCCHPDCYPN